jgi:hypothetical protein
MPPRRTRTASLPGLFEAGWAALFLALGTLLLGETPPAAPPAGGPYQRLVEAYMAGQWDAAAGMLAAGNRELQAVPASEQPKVTYIRQSLAECRPDAWWARCMAREKFVFTPHIWGHEMPATFDPAATNPVRLQFSRGKVQVTLMWPATMGENQVAKGRGFLPEDLTHLNVWNTLGMAEAWARIPLKAQTNLPAAAQVQLAQYMDFRSHLTGVYYGTPKARRWGLWLCMAMYVGENVGNAGRSAREAIAVVFMSEVAANPTRYPSIPLPKKLPDVDTEEKLAWELRLWIEKHGWTLVEDKLIRDAMAACAKANGMPAYQKGQVTLANGLIIDLDPAKDTPLRQQRDSWFQAKLAAAAQGK